MISTASAVGGRLFRILESFQGVFRWVRFKSLLPPESQVDLPVWNALLLHDSMGYHRHYPAVEEIEEATVDAPILARHS